METGFGSSKCFPLGATVYLDGVNFSLFAYWEPLAFELPLPPPDSSEGWRRVIDTYLESPEDYCDGAEPFAAGSTYRVQPRSVVLLVTEISY